MTKSIRDIAPVTLKQVQIEGGFWGERLCTNREITLPIEYKQCKATGRIDAFKLDWKPGDPNPPHIFWDSDVAKWIEAASHSLAVHPDVSLEKKVDGVIDLVAKAQQEDGYLNTHFTAVEPEKRWTNLCDLHELYCAGHLMEAAVAYYAATGKQKLLDVMCRYANHIDTIFGGDRDKKRGYPGHEEIELALVKLYRATGIHRYLDLAKFFVDERGSKPYYFDKEAKARGEDARSCSGGGYDYCQAHVPVREQKTAEGHAVRACYLYAGMADVAAETGDKELLTACRKIWKNIAERRMYVHGGIGSTRFGERFTLDYDLPNEEAYAETCAAIALVFFAHRMLQIEPNREYSDVMERALYNSIISGVSLDGTRFFYDNYLASSPGTHRFTGQKSPVRQEWFGTACCPTNLARLLASLGQYVYSQASRCVYVHLFVSGQAKIKIADQIVTLIQRTEYPWKEDIRIQVLPESAATFTIAVRIPGWCRQVQLQVNDEVLETGSTLRKGYVRIRRRWQKGDQVKLRLLMPVERMEAHPSVRHDCGHVALQRGPVVYCLEETDHGKNLNDIFLPRDSRLRVKKGTSSFLNGIPVITARALRRDPRDWKGKLYRSTRSRLQSCEMTAIPYFMWANRGEGEMLVWIREAECTAADG